MAATNTSPDGNTAARVAPHPTTSPPVRGVARHRHPADAEDSGPGRLGLLWGLAAVALTALLGGAALHRPPRAGEGALAANGFLLTHSGTVPGVPALSPHGVAALHMALYATLTRAFSRNDVLVPAGRELLLLSAVLSAAMIWWVAHRLRLGHAAASVAVVIAALPLLFPGTALLDVPAQLAVPWFLAAIWAAAVARRMLRLILALPALAVAVLLAPALLVPVLAAAAAAAFPPGSRTGHRAGSAGALGLGVGAAVVAVLLSIGRLGPETVPAAAAAPALPAAGALVLAVCFLVVGGIAARVLSAFRVPAAALFAGSLAAFLPLDRLAMLLVCLPLAAVLTAALLARLTDARLTDRIPGTSPRGVRAGGAVVLAALAGVAVLSLIRGPGSTPSTGGPAQLLRWTQDELPAGVPVLAPPAQWAELVRAGADEKQLRLPATGEHPQLEIVLGTSPPGALVLTRLPGGPGRPPLYLVDRRPGVPTAAELARRRGLAAALLANPVTTTGPRAAAVLQAASIDQRLLTVLAALGAQFGVGVRDLPPAAGAPRETLARYALLDRLGNERLVPGSPATTRLLAWLSAQLPPFHADSVHVLGNGVLIGFRYVSAPDAVVTAAVR